MNTETETISQTEYQRRRNAVFQNMNEGIVLLPSAPKVKKTTDLHYPYHPDMDLHYLTGIEEENVLGVLKKDRDQNEFMLFLREKDSKTETWSGKMLGHEKARTNFQVDQVFPFTEIENELPSLLQGHKQVYLPLARYDWFDERILSTLEKLRSQARSGKPYPTHLTDLSELVHPIRQKKSSSEIAQHKKAIQITWKGLQNAFDCCSTNTHERELEAELHRTYRREGATSQAFHAFPPIVASGNNATVLHYTDNEDPIQQDDLVLIDTGATWNHHCADITRTIPASGSFSDDQKRFYNAVLDCQKQIIDLIQPGIHYGKLQTRTEELLTEHMIEMNLLEGPLDEALQTGEKHGDSSSNADQSPPFKEFFMHKIGHWLGLNVHDAGPYAATDEQNQWVSLHPGMLLTIEPGLYVPETAENVPDQWKGMGVRIEDDVLVTESGCTILSDMIPRETDDLESFLN